MNQTNVLENMVVRILGEDAGLKASFDNAIAASKKTVTEIEKQWADGMGGLGDDFGKSFREAFEAVSKEAQRTNDRVKPASESMAASIRLINQEIGLATQQFRAGATDSDSYGAALDKATYSLKQMEQTGELTRAELIALGRANLAAEKGYQALATASDETGLSTEHLKNLVHELRHATEADTMTRQESIEAFRRVREEALAEAAALESGTKSKRDLTGVAATAARSIKTLEGNLTTLGLSGNVAVAMSRTLEGRMQAISEEAKQVQSAIAPLTGGPGGGGILSLIMGGAQAFGAASLARTGIAGAIGLEDFLMTLRTISDQGQRIFDELYEASDRLPATWEQLMRGTQALTGYGIAADNVVPVLENLSTISTALGGNLESMVRVYGRVRAAGRVSMQEINSLTDQGVPVFAALAQQMGVAETQVRELVSSGVVGFDDFAAAMASMTEEGGRFFGLLDEMERTTSGKLRRLADGWSIVTDTIGENLLPTYNRLIDTGQRLVSWFNDLDEGTQGVIVRFGVASTAASTFGTLALALGANIGRVTAAFTAMRTVMMASPWGWIALGISGLAGLTTWLVTSRRDTDALGEAQDRLRDAAGRMRTGLLDAVDAVERLQDATSIQGLRGSVQSLAAGMNDEGRNAFIAYAEQALLSATDVETAGNKIIAKWAEIQQEARQADLAIATADLRSLEGMATARYQAANLTTTGLDSRSAMYADMIADAWERRTAAAVEFNFGVTTWEAFQAQDQSLWENIQQWEAAKAAVDAYNASLPRQEVDVSDLGLDAARAVVAGLEAEVARFGQIMEMPDEAGNILRASVGNLGTDAGKQYADAFNAAASGSVDPLAGIRLWTSRLTYELEQGLISPVGVIRELGGHFDWLTAKRDDLFAAGGFGTDAWTQLNQELALTEATLNAATDLIPQLLTAPQDDGGGLSQTEADAYAAAQAIEALTIAQEDYLARLARTPEANLDAFRQAQAYRQVVLAMQDGDAAAARTARTAAEAAAEAEAAAARMQALMMLQTARTFSPPRPDEGEGGDLGGIYERLREEIALAEHQAIAFGNSFDLNSAKAAAYRNAINALLAEGIDPLSNAVGILSDQFRKAAASGEKLMPVVEEIVSLGTKVQRDFGIKAVFDPSAFNAANESISDWLGTAPTQWDEMRKAIAEALDHRIISEYEAEMAELAVRGMETEESFRSMASSVGGLGGDILNLVADFGKAIVAFSAVTDEADLAEARLTLVAAGFNAATGAVKAFNKAFADGFDGNALLSGLVGVGSGIASLIGGPAMGEAFAAIGGFVQSILGDLSNGIASITKQVQDMAASSRTLTSGTLQAFADASTTRVSRGGFLGWLGFTKAELNKEAMNILTGIAESVAGGLGSAFSATDLTDFREAFNVGIDKVIQDQILQGFILGPEVQAAIERITFLLAENDYAGARREYERIQDSAEDTWHHMQEWNREMGKLPDSAKDYTDAIRDAVRATQDLLAGTASNQLERAWATGAVGIEEYARALQELRQTEIGLSFTRELDDIDRQIADAIKEGADAGFIAALQDQKQALQDAYRDALEQGAFEAAEAIKNILGTSVSTLSGAIRQAFDSTDVLGNFGQNMLQTTRNAFIAAFLETEQIKSAMARISDLMTDSLIDGILTDAELEAIKKEYTALGGELEAFESILAALGLSFGDLNDTVDSLTASMTNVPSIFKGVLSEWNASNVAGPGGFVPTGFSVASANTNSHSGGGGATHIHVTVTGDIYGMDDFDTKVIRAVDSGNQARSLRTNGL